jgi:hypothetical protein
VRGVRLAVHRTRPRKESGHPADHSLFPMPPYSPCSGARPRKPKKE